MEVFYNNKKINIKEIIEKEIKVNSANLQKLKEKVGVSSLKEFIDFIEEKYKYLIEEYNKPIIVIFFNLLDMFEIKYRIKSFNDIGNYKVISYCKLGKLIADNYRIKEYVSIKFDLIENNTTINAKIYHHNRKINGNSILGIFDIEHKQNIVEDMLNNIYSLLNVKIK